MKGLDVVFTFDTTGSMYPCLAEVKLQVQKVIAQLFTEIEDLRVGVIVHGDYCDERSSYVTKQLDLTRDLNKLVQFVRSSGATGGGDEDECYELVLHQCRSLTWSAERARVVVLIGDASPHSPNYKLNVNKLDWKNEARLLHAMDVKVYSVQCLSRAHNTPFYQQVAEITDGKHIKLNQFRWINDLIQGVAYQLDSTEKFEEFEAHVKTQSGYNLQQQAIFDSLAGRTPTVRETPRTPSHSITTTELKPVNPSRFQYFEVHGQPSIRDFVLGMGIPFKVGRGFYPHVSRTEVIQEKKEIILEDLVTGEMYEGLQAREMIGLPYGKRGSVPPNPLRGYRCWVQSTSSNRVLREKGFMYEVV